MARPKKKAYEPKGTRKARKADPAESAAAHLRRMGIYSEARVPMSLHTSVGVGGPADIMAFPDTSDEAVAAKIFAVRQGLKSFIIGEGTNLLVRDGGLEGLVINMAGVRGRRHLDENTIEAVAGEPLPKLANWAATEGLAGIEFTRGIPGTLGGAIVMNAGAYGAELSQFVTQVTILPPGEEKPEKVEYSHFSPSHRSTTMEAGTLVLRAELVLEHDVEAKIQARMRELLDKRRKRQPLGLPSFGCTFKNPPGEHAGKIIEELKLKGKHRGGAQISEVHGNFIINHENAKTKDFLKLIELVQKKAFEQKGIKLELEVRIVGRN